MEKPSIGGDFRVIRPERVRYIKLGEGGIWEAECLERGIIRFGFDSARPDRFSLCRSRRWSELTESFISQGRDKGTATRFTNEARLFFEDSGATLWITFVGERLCWGLLTQDAPEIHSDGRGVWRVVARSWRWKDLNGEELTKDRLSGALAKLASYRGTSCDVDVADYAVRRINGQKTPEVERALIALEEMKRPSLELMKLLGPRDFETLVNLVFSTSGWRRLGVVGRTQKTLEHSSS
jgi:hypothetical protein